MPQPPDSDNTGTGAPAPRRRLYSRVGERRLEQPALILGLEGWFDAGVAAAGAVAALLEAVATEVIAEFDVDVLLDHRARRPTVRIEDGMNTGLRWPELVLRAGKDAAGHDVLFLVGPEPDHEWRSFAADVVALARELGVRIVVGLGAFPAPAPHTRPVRLAATATTPELAAQVGFVPGSIELPAGVQATLERRFADAGIPAVGVWARVPHYIATMPYPAASAALVDMVTTVAGLDLAVPALDEAVAVARERIDELVAQNPDHQAMVANLEAQVDAEAVPPPLNFDDLPTGDEIAAELQRFLRDQGQG